MADKKDTSEKEKPPEKKAAKKEEEVQALVMLTVGQWVGSDKVPHRRGEEFRLPMSRAKTMATKGIVRFVKHKSKSNKENKE